MREDLTSIWCLYICVYTIKTPYLVRESDILRIVFAAVPSTAQHQ